MEASSLGLSAVFLLGLSFGAGPCTVSCLPFIGPVFLANNRPAWQTIVPFSTGRLSGYSLLGCIAAYFGYLLEDWLASHWPGLILGYATLLLAFMLLLKPKKTGCSKKPAQQQDTTIRFKPRQSGFQGSLFLLGLGMTLNPCAPLSIVIAAAATTGSPQLGLLLGISFGLGAVILPAFLLYFGLTHFSQAIRHALSQWRSQIKTSSILMLIAMGTATAMGWITL